MEETKVAVSNKEEATSDPVRNGISNGADALYLYCIAEGNEKVSFGKIGVDRTEVYTIPHDGLLAAVHNCSTQPYKSEDTELVKRWMIAHQKVVDMVWERFGTILPSGFDNIIKRR